MTEHKPGDVVGTFAGEVQIQVTSDHASKPNSYRAISCWGTLSDDADTATVTIEAGETFFQYEGELFMFDGVTYRPNSNYRDDADPLTDGKVNMVFPDGFHPDEGHTFNPLHGTFTLSDFADALVSGELEPAKDPEGVHD